MNPYHDPGQFIGDLRIPMICICHCNDCRRATSSILPIGLVTHLPTVSVCLDGSESGTDETWLPAAEVFDYKSISNRKASLTFYKSSEGRTRWFCGRCGTNLAYSIDPGVIPEEWDWPKMLDIWLGTVDREDLEGEQLVPERQLWCDKGVNWIRKFATAGAGGIPEHPLSKINVVVDK